MTTLVVKWLISALAIFLVGSFLPGIHVPDYLTALWVALVWGVVNALIRPILLFITLPINLLTLGIFTFILNGFMFWIIPFVVKSFRIDGFWWAVLGALIVSSISTIANRFFLGENGRVGED